LPAYDDPVGFYIERAGLRYQHAACGILAEEGHCAAVGFKMT